MVMSHLSIVQKVASGISRYKRYERAIAVGATTVIGGVSVAGGTGCAGVMIGAVGAKVTHLSSTARLLGLRDREGVVKAARAVSAIRVVAGILASLLLGAQASAVSTTRGVWNFDVTNHPVASSTVVGNSALETTVLAKYSQFGINRSYDSFRAPVPPPSASDNAAWHVKLNAAGVTPYFLVSDAAATIDLSVIQAQVIDFNNGRPANEQYAGVKLDLEPQADPAWNAADTSLAASINRRDMLNTLENSFSSVRSLLDGAGLNSMPIFADLPVFFDNLDGFIGWGEGTGLTATQERDQWFTDLASSLDGITLMAFGTPFINVIESNVSWEISNFTKDVRVALEVNIPGTWTDLADFLAAADQIEAFYNIPANNPSGHSIGIDIQDFAQLFDAAAPEPMTAVLSFMGLGALLTQLRRRSMV